ncbi:MAG: hypothetical protein ACI35O_04100 [Bacillaceae bacterium]
MSEKLHEASNNFHDVVSDYIKEKGFDSHLKLMVESKIKWLQMKAEKNGVTLDIED